MKRLVALCLCLVLVCGSVAFAGETLVPLSYLQTVFQESFLSAVSQRAEESLTDQTGTDTGIPLLSEFSLKEQDTLTLKTGSVILPYTGALQLQLTSGTVVDATTGETLSNGSFLTANHRYVAAENTTACFTVVSQVAVVTCEGVYTLTESTDTVDYIAMADALKTLGLFKGSDTGYGSGYNLDRYPTRLEALIMFIRVLGEEEAALASTASHPFTDVPGWGNAYVAYAYEKGYTNGVSETLFGTNNKASAISYVEFLLRALGISKAGVDDYTTALTRGQDCGLLTAAERSYLETEGFYRAQVAYLSFVALQRPISGVSLTLGEMLVQKNIFPASQLSDALKGVSSIRLTHS